MCILLQIVTGWLPLFFESASLELEV